MRKIRKGDDVIVLTGKDKGKRGTVLSVTRDNRAYVEGINMVKRHVKANPMLGTPGGIIEKEAPIHISNIALFNTETGKGERVGIRVLEDGRKVRYFKSTGKQIDV